MSGVPVPTAQSVTSALQRTFGCHVDPESSRPTGHVSGSGYERHREREGLEFGNARLGDRASPRVGVALGRRQRHVHADAVASTGPAGPGLVYFSKKFCYIIKFYDAYIKY